MHVAVTHAAGRRLDFLPYGRQWLSDEDIAAVVATLRSDWLTTGPAVERFEAALARHVAAATAVAVSSGTAALHAAMFALGVGPGDEVIVPTLTFAATANAVVYQGGTPVFADVDPATLLVDPAAVEALISPRTKAIVAVDYAGQPCDYTALRAIAGRHGLALVADAAHSLGASDAGRRVGTLADLTTFSFHPVKAITSGEGGAVTTADRDLAARLRRFRTHGIDREGPLTTPGRGAHEMVELGYNYRLSDIHAALGLSQLERLPAMIARRQAIAGQYLAALSGAGGMGLPAVREDVSHAYHLFVVLVKAVRFGMTRNELQQALHRRGIGTQVHYLPVHLQPFYRQRFGTRAGQCPHAEQAYRQILSLPIFPAMKDSDVQDVLVALLEFGDLSPLGSSDSRQQKAPGLQCTP